MCLCECHCRFDYCLPLCIRLSDADVSDVGVGKGASSDVLIKNAESLEKMNAIDIVVVDMTGTITERKPSVEKVISAHADYSETDVLQKLSSLNSSNEHPLARATLLYAEEKRVPLFTVSNFEPSPERVLLTYVRVLT